MKTLFQKFFLSLPLGARLLVLLYAVGFPLSLVGHHTHTVELYDWLALWPALVWKGEVWCVLTYAFLPNGPVDWVVSLFWLATLVAIIGRNWSSRELLGYCLLTTVVGALVVLGADPRMQGGVVGNGAMIFALLAPGIGSMAVNALFFSASGNCRFARRRFWWRWWKSSFRGSAWDGL